MKRKILNGNYDLKANPEIEKQEEQLESEFDRAAIERLGGSIAFVRGGKLYEENS